MSLRERLTRKYFDAVYNPLYDASTARLSRYIEAQDVLVRSLQVEAGQRILCAGLGTGNELTSLRAHEPWLNLVGIDLSRAALARARCKPAGSDCGTALMLMDAQRLGFSNESFDRLLCYHVLDFTGEAGPAVGEFLRVLKPGGRFVISFPSESEGPGLGAALLGNSIKSSTAQTGCRIGRVARTLLAGFIYLPLTLRRHPTTYTPDEIEALLRSRGAADVVIESDPVYRDHIARGEKKKGG
jgi:ubiquinone/menaquinone biosynthesis C-methylase UbiE